MVSIIGCRISQKASTKEPKVQVRYQDTLDTVSKETYFDKLQFIEDKDLYELPRKEWSSGVNKWPEIAYPDIISYLIYNQSIYPVHYRT